MTTSSSVVFFGTERFSAPSLLALIKAGYDIQYVVTKPDSARGRGRKTEPPEVKKIALLHNIPVLQPQRVVDIESYLASLDQPVGVLVAYGKILPQSTIDLFRPGIINVHPSLLPTYRGPSPIEAAILNGDSETGVSIMQLSAKMDAGPIYHQDRVALSGRETRPELYTALSEQGAKILVATLPNILNGSLQPIAQDESTASYCSLLAKDDGLLDPEHKTASQLEREVRAYLDYPKSRYTLYDHPVIITKAHVESTSGALSVHCNNNTYLSIDELIAPSGKKMNAEAFIRGYKQ